MVVTANVKRAAVVSQVLLTSSIALLTHATKTGGDYSYNTLTVQLFAEVRDPSPSPLTVVPVPSNMSIQIRSTFPVGHPFNGIGPLRWDRQLTGTCLHTLCTTPPLLGLHDARSQTNRREWLCGGQLDSTHTSLNSVYVQPPLYPTLRKIVHRVRGHLEEVRTELSSHTGWPFRSF
jgi:hypothetical protein